MTWSVRGDWGTTRLRLYRIVDGEVAERLDGPGIGLLDESPAKTLGTLLGNWAGYGKPAQISLVGMAGSRSGLIEALYVACPATVSEWIAAAACTDHEGIPIRVGAGVRQDLHDVMRGEEAQVFGALALEPALSLGTQAVVLPGTHSKWVTVTDGAITSFRTYPTGELFALLRSRSTLLNVGETTDAGDEHFGWQAGLALAQHDANLLGTLFRTRAAQLLEDRTPAWAEGFLSGLLIGAEIAQVGKGQEQPIVIAEVDLAARYCAALRSFGFAPRSMNGDACVLKGLELLDRA